MLKHNHNLKDEAFLDIYRAIGLVGDDICQQIMNYKKIGDDELNKLYEKINHWSNYFNMALLKVLMLYDSKRGIEIFENFNLVEKKYESKTIMKSELERMKIEKQKNRKIEKNYKNRKNRKIEKNYKNVLENRKNRKQKKQKIEKQKKIIKMFQKQKNRKNRKKL